MTRADHAMLKEIGRVSSLERERDHYRDALRSIADAKCSQPWVMPGDCRCLACIAASALEEKP